MKFLFIGLIKIYQVLLSPLQGLFLYSGCRFYPSCSNYTIKCIREFGVFGGMFKGFVRLLKCNPWS